MREQDAQERAEWRPVTQNDTPGVVGSVIIRVPLAADCQRTRSGPPGARWLPHAPDTPGEGGGRYPVVRIGILWPEIGILRRAGDGHALEVSLACRAGLALDMWTLTLVKLCDFSNLQGYGGWCSRALLWPRLLSERNSSLSRGDFVCQLWPAYAGRKCCAARAEAFVTQRLGHARGSNLAGRSVTSPFAISPVCIAEQSACALVQTAIPPNIRKVAEFD